MLGEERLIVLLNSLYNRIYFVVWNASTGFLDLTVLPLMQMLSLCIIIYSKHIWVVILGVVDMHEC